MHEDGQPPRGRTSLAVRGAIAGDREQLEWLLLRFTPMMMAAARMHLGRAQALRIEPEDLAHEVWAIVIPKLGRIEAQGDRFTPVLLTFLASTMRLHLQTLLRMALRNEHERLSTEPAICADTAGVVTRAARDEHTQQLLHAIDQLDAADREVVVMRAIEQLPNHEVALVLGENANTIAKRYGRALERLRHLVPGTVLDDL